MDCSPCVLHEGIPVAVGRGGLEVFQLLVTEPDATPELVEKTDVVSVGTELEVAANIVNELERLAGKLPVGLSAPVRLLDVCSPLVTCMRVLSELI